MVEAVDIVVSLEISMGFVAFVAEWVVGLDHVNHKTNWGSFDPHYNGRTDQYVDNGELHNSLNPLHFDFYIDCLIG